MKRLLEVGQTALGKSDFSAAFASWQEGLALAKTQGDKEWEGKFLHNLGVGSYRKSDYDKAMEYALQAVTVREAVGKKLDIAESLNLLGNVYSRLGKLDDSEKALTHALEINRSLDDKPAIAASLNNLGGIAQSKGDMKTALDDFQQAHGLYVTLNLPSDVAMTLGNMGQVYSITGLYEKALECHLKALEIRKPLGNPAEIAVVLGNLGDSYINLGQYSKALEYLDNALKIQQPTGNRQDIADTLTNEAIAYDDLGEPDKALTLHTKALELREAVGNPQEVVRSLTNVGGIYAELGAYDKALTTLQRAYRLNDHNDNKQDIAGTLVNLGDVYYQIGQLQQALDLNQQALPLFEAVGDQPNAALCYDNIGSILYERDQLTDALTYQNKARQAREKYGDPALIAISLQNIGLTYLKQRRFDLALDLFTKSLKLREGVGNSEEVANSHANLGALYRDMGKFDLAEQALTKAMALYRQRPDDNRRNLAACLGNLAQVYMERGQLDRANAAYREAQQSIEALAQQIKEASQIGAFQEAQSQFYARYAAVLVRQKRPMDALRIVERGRGTGIARQIVQSRANIAVALNQEDALHFKALDRKVSAARSALFAALGRPLPSDSADAALVLRAQKDAGEHLSAAQREWTLFRDEMAAKNPAFARVHGIIFPSVTDMERLAALHPDTLFLEWAIVDEKSTLLFALAHKSGLQAFPLPVGLPELKTLRKAWRARLLDRESDKKEAAALYTRLFGALEKANLLAPGRFARLLLVPDGPLNDIPFAALLDSKRKRLVERYALAYSVSLGILTWPDERRAPAKTLLCATDPLGDFEKGPQLEWRGGFGALRFARQEGEVVSNLFTGSRLLEGRQARESVIKREMGKYALLHFATHGILDMQNGLFSGLLFAPEPGGSDDDGVLEAREILDMKLSARMAALSACQSGRGEVHGGDGALGLAWAFRAAGCPSLVVSQWAVDDAGTSRLMERFYAALRSGKRKDEALRRAMRELIRERAVPFLWAGFQIVGDTERLPAKLFAGRPPRIVRSAVGARQEMRPRYANVTAHRER